MEYYPNDYSRSGTNISSIQTGSTTPRYTGMINGMAWYTQRTAASGSARTAFMNSYVYDIDCNLSANNWGVPDFTNRSFVATTNAWQEKGLTYDSHGNIKTLQRTNGSGATIANYSYSYKANSNQLTGVGSYASYTYDALGQLNSETKGTMSKYLEYDVSGKVTKIYSDAAKTKLVLSFVYDESGARIKKQDHLQNVSTWYVGGNVYNGTQLIEQSIPSGIYYRVANAYRYQLTDNVGSVRAIIARSKLSSGAVDVIYSTDYYPFGTELGAAGIASRYGYQGEYAEKDGETGWNNFYLRNYDPAIGRWLSVDPYGQYNSPYVGMGNDPINRFDPDGGWDWPKWVTGFFNNLTGGDNKTYKGQDIEEVTIYGSKGVDVSKSRTYFSAATPEFNSFTYRSQQYALSELSKTLNYNDLSHPLTSLAIGKNVADNAGMGAIVSKGAGVVNALRSTIWGNAAKTSTKLLPEAYSRFSRFEYHFGKHAGEFGAAGKDAYYKRGLSLLDGPVGGNVQGFTNSAGYTFRMNMRTGEFGVMRPNGVVETFYRRLSDPAKYWAEQVAKWNK